MDEILLTPMAVSPGPDEVGLCFDPSKPVIIPAMAIRRVVRRTAGSSAVAERPRERGLGRVEHRPALVEQVVEQLRTYIIEGKFPADHELPPEAALCETLGVSRTVVREAMRILRAQGLVDVSQGKRPRVRPVDAQVAIDGLSVMLRRSNSSLLHLVELRRPLESEIAAVAAQRVTPEQIALLEISIEELKSAKDLPGRAAADLKFHSLLADATGNPIFQLVLRTVWTLQWQSSLKTIKYSSAAVAVKWHERILSAVRDHDSARARAEMTGHIEAANADLLKADRTGE
jgi:GntR family transcriptional repressor for pyruvate dehydrogenase complex